MPYSTYNMPSDKDKILKRQDEILELIRVFSSEKLNDEYFELAKKILNKLERKRNVPFETGKVEVWAVAIIHAVGMVNFLFDPSQNPHTSSGELNAFFGTSQSTTTQKSKMIRDLLKLRQWDPEFSTREMIARNPYLKIAMLDGFIVHLE